MMRKGTGAGVLWLGSALALVAMAQPALGQSGAGGQDAPPASTAKPVRSSQDSNSDIVVTATRRDALLSKVPISVSAFSEKRVDQLGIKNFADVARFTPGIAISQSNSGNDNIAIRGVSSNAGAATTGIYIDDTPIQIRQLGLNSNGAGPIIFDLDRVEVLRGPQGTLFGSGSEGGTVRYITPAPNLDHPTVYARSEFDTTQEGSPSYEGGVSVGMPIVKGTLAARASAYYRQDGGYINRLDANTLQLAKKDANSVDQLALRLAVEWQPAPGLKIEPSVQYQNRLNHGTDTGGYYLGLSNPTTGNYNEATPTPLQDRDHFVLGAVKLDWDAGPVKLISNTSYFKRTENINGYDGTTYNLSYFQHSLDPNAAGYGTDPSGASCTNTPAGVQGIFSYDANGNPVYGSGPNPNSSCTLNAAFLGKSSPLLGAQGLTPAFVAAFQAANNGQNYQAYNLIINKQQNFTQEVRLQSNTTGSKLDWTAGVFYSHIKQQSNERIYDPQLEQITQLLFGESTTDAWGASLLPGGYDYQNLGNSTEWQVAGFADATYAITPKLKVNVGLRWAKTHFSFTNVTQGPQAFVADGAAPTGGSQSGTPLTPKFNLSYQVTPGDMVYATVSKGFRAGGANAPLLPACGVTGPTSFNSDSLWNYEGGAKLKLFGGAIRLASSAYMIKWSNIQQSVYVNACGQQFVGNLGALTSKGFDLQVEAHPAQHLSMDLAVGYTHARYTTNSVIPAAAGVANAQALVVGIAGDTVPGAPWTVAAGIQYDFDFNGSKAFFRVDDEYASHNRAPLTQTDGRQIAVINYDGSGMASPSTSGTISYDPNLVADPATNELSIRLGMNFGKVDAAVFVNNLFNAHPQINYAHQDGTAGTYTASTIRPRTGGLFVTYRY